MIDMWDPNEWECSRSEPIPYRAITLSRDGAVFCIVDEDRYDELMAYGPWRLYEYRTKQYAKRDRVKGERGGATVYMHHWLAERYLVRPSRNHIIVDHKRSNGLDNRLGSMIWATPQQNRRNTYGMWWQNTDFIRELESGQQDRWYGTE